MNRNLEEAVKEERRTYFREWRAKNPEKVKRYNEGYWRRRAQRNADKKVEG